MHIDSPNLLRPSPLRILTVANVPPDPDSGAAGTVFHTNVALRELGHEVHEIWADQLAPRHIAHGNLHSLIEQPRVYRREVLKAVAAGSYDVVMMSQPQAYLAAKALKQRGFTGFVINRSHGVEFRANEALWHWHQALGKPISRFSRVTRLLQWQLDRQWIAAIRWSDAVVVPSEMDRLSLVQRVATAADRIQVIHHGVSDAFLQPDLALMPAEVRFRRLLYVGQYSFIKAPNVLVEVFNEVIRQRPDVKVTWVTSRSAHDEIRSELHPDAKSRVQLCEWCSNEELVNVYDQHGIFLFPSFMEGAGKSALEAMSRGMFVVASDSGGMHDYIRHTKAGMLCPPGDVKAFVDASLAAIDAPTVSASVGQAARQYAHAKTWQTCAASIASLVNQIGGESGSGNAMKAFLPGGTSAQL